MAVALFADDSSMVAAPSQRQGTNRGRTAEPRAGRSGGFFARPSQYVIERPGPVFNTHGTVKD